MNKHIKIRFLIFLGFLISFYNVMCMLSHLRSKGTFTKKKLPEVSEAIGLEEARSIYNLRGLANKTTMCQSIDKKTSRIKAYGLCKNVFERKYSKKISYDKIQVICQHVPVDKIAYKHSKIQKSSIYGPNVYTHFMAMCMWENRSVLYLLQGKDDHYYEFEHKKEEIKVDIIACRKISQTDFTYPDIDLKKTEDPQEANDIFAIFKTVPFEEYMKTGHHVCKEPTLHSGVRLGESVCKSYILPFYSRIVIDNERIRCKVYMKIGRAFINEMSGLKDEFEDYVSTAECAYWHRVGNIFKKGAMLTFNTTDPENKLFYIARFIRKKWRITSIFSKDDMSM